jgi:hypothetical protein
LGAQGSVAARRSSWLTPVALWWGILAGPVAWASDLVISYALVKPACGAQRSASVQLVGALALVLVITGGVTAWRALHDTSPREPTDGGRSIDRARFMALLGVTISTFFIAVVFAEAIPVWVIDACL